MLHMDVIFTLALVSANIKGSAMDEDVRASRLGLIFIIHFHAFSPFKTCTILLYNISKEGSIF